MRGWIGFDKDLIQQAILCQTLCKQVNKMALAPELADVGARCVFQQGAAQIVK